MKPTIKSLQADLTAQKEWYEQRISAALDDMNKRQATFDERGKRIAEMEKQLAGARSDMAHLQARADRVTYYEGMIAGFERAGIIPVQPRDDGDFPSEDSYGARGTIWKK